MMKSNKNKYPLKIVISRGHSGDYMGYNFSRLVLLECGHKVPPSTDFYGDTLATKQRCRLCYENSLTK